MPKLLKTNVLRTERHAAVREGSQNADFSSNPEARAGLEPGSVCGWARPLHTRVQRLRCFRGIDDLTALTIAAELGDPRRFPTAPSTMAFVGLVPSDASGTHRARGGITKTGNAHLRRVLVEAA